MYIYICIGLGLFWVVLGPLLDPPMKKKTLILVRNTIEEEKIPLYCLEILEVLQTCQHGASVQGFFNTYISRD